LYWENYIVTHSLNEALSVLACYDGEAQVVAGGTDLVLQLREKKQQVKALVDISGLTELKQIREVDGWLRVGALSTHTQITRSPLIRAKAAALAEAAASVGSAQIRNVGTVGGNVVNAQPAADTAIALLALDARVTVISRKGEIIRPLSALFRGVGQSAVDPTTEIVSEFLLPLSSGRTASSFKRLSRRKALSLPILNTAVSLELTSDLQRFSGVRIAAGPVAPVPWRAGDAEALLEGSPVSEKLIREACLLAADKATPRDSLRGSAAYRREMVKVLVYRAIKAAVEELGGVVNA
jgi:carbon-monoxide dehydrogenase medium subunit